MGELPLQFGPGSLNRVVRESIQALVDAAPDPRAVTTLLPQGTGKVIIKSECIELLSLIMNMKLSLAFLFSMMVNMNYLSSIKYSHSKC